MSDELPPDHPGTPPASDEKTGEMERPADHSAEPIELNDPTLAGPAASDAPSSQETTLPEFQAPATEPTQGAGIPAPSENPQTANAPEAGGMPTGHEPTGSMAWPAPEPGFKGKLAALGPRMKQFAQNAAQKWRDSGYGEKIAAKAREWRLRERFQKILPKDLAQSMPTTFEPAAVAEWAGQAVSRQGAALYGTAFTVVASTWFLADLSALLVERAIPEPPVAHMARTAPARGKTRSPDDYNLIYSRNLFNSAGIIPGENQPGTQNTQTQLTDQGGAPTRTTLPFNLVGTLILRNELRSIATIEDKTASMVYPVRIEDEIPGKAKIISVESRRVVFVNLSSGRREFVELPEEKGFAPKINAPAPTKPSGAGIERTAANQFNVARTEVDKALADLNQVLTQARAVPNFENGMPAGYKLFQIVPGSIYDKLGLQNGDTLCGLNGEGINDPGKAFELLGQLKTASRLELCVKRDGRQSNFNYEIR